MKARPSANFVILNKQKNKHDESPIRLVINDGKSKKRYGIGLSILEDSWQKLHAPKLKDPKLKEIRLSLDAIRIKAEKVIDELDPFTFESFENRFFGKDAPVQAPVNTTLEHLFDQYIAELKSNAQIGTAMSYQTTINSLLLFKPDIHVADINATFLKAYHNKMKSDGKSDATIGIYMRQLRKIMNLAIKDKIISAEDSPFPGYNIPSSVNVKQALNSSDLRKLLSYSSEDKWKQFAIDFWTFSYLCNGMNFADIAHLKKSDIQDNFLSFERQKTLRTKKNKIIIKVALLPSALEIIKKYEDTDQNNPYLFKILSAELTPVKMKYRIQQFIHMVNKYMKLIRIELNINKPCNTYAARHSYATLLKNKGVPTSYIKEALGHSSLITTESYLDSFPDEDKLKYANLLTNL